jgi:hypothetical protein
MTPPCLSRSRTATVISDGLRPRALAMASMFSETGASMSMVPFAPRPTSNLLMYMSAGVLSMLLPLGAAATAEMDPSCPFTSNCKPSTGSTARSASGPPVPSASPGPSIPGWHFGALTRPFSSRRCSRSTVTLPATGTLPNSSRNACAANVYARSESPDASRCATLSATRSVTVAYSTAAEAKDPEWESVTLMGSHRTSILTKMDRKPRVSLAAGSASKRCELVLRPRLEPAYLTEGIIHQLPGVDHRLAALSAPPPPALAREAPGPGRPPRDHCRSRGRASPPSSRAA